MSVKLYPFQEEDVNKHAKQKNGLVGSAMGCGKTHIAIALDEMWYTQSKRPTLVIAPINTFDSWVEKYAEQSPQSDVTVIDRKNRTDFLEKIRKRQGDVFVMHWDAVRLMPELQKFNFGLIVGDEVHRISNRKAQVTRAVKKLHADHVLGLSGTASGDQPQYLWSVLNWLWPSYFRSYWKFFERYCETDTVYAGESSYQKVVGTRNLPELHELMSPWYSRHLKREQCCEHHPNGVMDWLPEKTYTNMWVELNPTQRRIYDQMRKDMIAWVGEHEGSPLVASVVVAQMTRLSQMALATPDFDSVTGKVSLREPSSKLDAVQELIEDNPGKQFVIFSSSKQVCYLAEQKFKKVGIESFVLSGDTPQSQRDGMVGRFQNGDAQLFIGVIQAAAEGIDGLQYATDTAIFLDRSWSTVKNMQAEDRLHRDGAKDAVQIIDVMARNTLDFGRKQRLETKWEWIRSILGDPAKEQVRVTHRDNTD